MAGLVPAIHAPIPNDVGRHGHVDPRVKPGDDDLAAFLKRLVKKEQ